MKRWMIPVVALLMALCAVCAFAETDGFTYDDWYGGVKTYSGPGGEVTVPAVIDGEAMTHLADSLLEDNLDITSLTIPEGYTVSGRFVANNCAGLSELHFPESLVVIGNSSFQNLTAVTELTIPAGVALIGSNALSSGGFTSVTFEGVPPIMESGALSWLPDEVVFHVPDDCFDEYEALLTDDSCLGTWYAILMGTGAQVIQPVQDWHLVITLTLNEDGSYSEDYTDTSDGHWTADSESGALVLEGGGMDGYRLRLREDGLLQYGEVRQGMVFARDSETTLDWQSELNDAGSEVPEA